MIKHKIIQKNKNAAVVEYQDETGINRGIIPIRAVDTITEKNIDQAIPYGYPWDELDLKFDATMFKNAMYNRGIWTAQDALKNPSGVLAAIQTALGATLADVLTAARLEIKRG